MEPDAAAKTVEGGGGAVDIFPDTDPSLMAPLSDSVFDGIDAKSPEAASRVQEGEGGGEGGWGGGGGREEGEVEGDPVSGKNAHEYPTGEVKIDEL